MLSSVKENQDIAIMEYCGAQSIMSVIRLVIAKRELLSSPSREELAIGLLKIVSVFAV